MVKGQRHSQTLFLVLLTVVHGVFVALFSIFVRYDPISAKAHYSQEDEGKRKEALHKLEGQYPMAMDIQIMLFLGFGFLMTFMKRYSYSAIVFVMAIVTVSVEWGVLCFGAVELMHSEEGIIHISWAKVMDAAIGSAAPLVSFGVIIGKFSPLQLLAMTLIEIPLFVGNAYIGYTVLGALDAGGTIFVHTFGAYFGLAVSLVTRYRNYEDKRSEEFQNSTGTTDLFSFLGTLLLWVYWPSFNAYLVFDDAKHRSILNTYLSLSASTVTTLICSGIFGDGKRFNAVDLQNASLAGGVMVGAVSDLVLQPYGAIIAGSIAGIVATFGYQVLQGSLADNLNLHDSCGVNNLHGIPGILGACLSAVIALTANTDNYGDRLYEFYPALAPTEPPLNDSSASSLDPVAGRSPLGQAWVQMAALGITLLIAIVGGLLTGFLLKLDWLCSPLRDGDLFQDDLFFEMPDEDPEDSENNTTIEAIEEIKQICKHSEHKQIVREGTPDPTRIFVTTPRNSIAGISGGGPSMSAKLRKSPPHPGVYAYKPRSQSYPYQKFNPDLSSQQQQLQNGLQHHQVEASEGHSQTPQEIEAAIKDLQLQQQRQERSMKRVMGLGTSFES